MIRSNPINRFRTNSALMVVLKRSEWVPSAGRPHEVLLLPGAGHQALSEEIAEKPLWHQVRFLQRHLGVDPQP